MRTSKTAGEDVVKTLAGALAGAVTAVTVCPLDVIRTRFQVQSRSFQYAGLASAVKRIGRREGIAGFYKGLSPTVIALVPNWTVYFTVYEYLKQLEMPFINGRNHSAVHLVAAIGAGMSTVIVTNPLWVVKTRLQTQDMGIDIGWNRYRGTVDALTQIVKTDGVSRLYAGLVPSLIGIAHVAVQFPLYENLKRRLAVRKGRPEGPLSVNELIVASSLSKIVASTTTYPHEVIRSHMHLNGTKPFCGLATTIRHVFREHGLGGFYRGCGINLCRAVPSAAITITSYELICRLLDSFVNNV